MKKYTLLSWSILIVTYAFISLQAMDHAGHSTAHRNALRVQEQQFTSPVKVNVLLGLYTFDHARMGTLSRPIPESNREFASELVKKAKGRLDSVTREIRKSEITSQLSEIRRGLSIVSKDSPARKPSYKKGTKRRLLESFTAASAAAQLDKAANLDEINTRIRLVRQKIEDSPALLAAAQQSINSMFKKAAEKTAAKTENHGKAEKQEKKDPQIQLDQNAERHDNKENEKIAQALFDLQDQDKEIDDQLLPTMPQPMPLKSPAVVAEDNDHSLKLEDFPDDTSENEVIDPSFASQDLLPDYDNKAQVHHADNYQPAIVPEVVKDNAVVAAIEPENDEVLLVSDSEVEEIEPPASKVPKMMGLQQAAAIMLKTKRKRKNKEIKPITTAWQQRERKRVKKNIDLASGDSEKDKIHSKRRAKA